jgi:hypothetical protein
MTRALLATALLLVGCTPTVVSDYCAIARPITFSGSLDSSETVRQIREHNASYLKSCP